MAETYYVLEKFAELHKTLKSACDAMPIKRKAIDIYRGKNNIEKAKDVYSELGELKKRVLSAVMGLQLLFSESDMAKEADYCNKLYDAVMKYQLMTTDYSKLLAALNTLLNVIPQNETTNASVIGRLMNNVKMGYYPTDLDHVSMIKNALVFPDNKVNVLDPCCGCGLALERLADGEKAETYGVELDESRGSDAETRLDRVGFGSFFHSRVSHEAFHALFLNPPYLSVINETGSKARSEKRFLVESLYHLMIGGVLIYIVPYYRLTSDICRVICDNFENLSIYRFLDKEFSRFSQIVLFGTRKKKSDGSQLAEQLSLYAMRPERIPMIDTLSPGKYSLPDVDKRVEIFKGAVFNLGELERQLAQSKSIDALFEKSRIDAMEKRPLLPLNIGQVGLIGGSGLINGYVDCEHPHLIKGRIIKEIKYREDKEEGTRTETRTNRMLFNILTPDGIKNLA